MKTKIKADQEQTAQSAYGYNPLYQKLTKLTWNAPSGGYHYYGPPPDVGTSYGMWWDQNNKFGVMAPMPENGTLVYSPATGNELHFEGPASTDAVYALINYKGSYEFMPPSTAGDTCLTTAPIFSKEVNTAEMYNPFTGAEITQEYQTMKANRTAQPAKTPPVAPVKAAAKSLKEGLGADPHKSSQKGADIKKNDDPYKDLTPAKSRQLASDLKSEIKKEAQKQLTAEIIDAMTEEELSNNLLSMLSKAAEGEEAAEAPPAEEAPKKSHHKKEEALPEAPPEAPPQEEAPPAAEEPSAEEAPAPEPAAEPAPEMAPPAPEPAPAPEAPPAEAPPAVEEAPESNPMSLAPPAEPGMEPSPEAPVPEVPSVQKEEPPTPTTKEYQGVESMNAQAKEMKALALKLLSDPDYMAKNADQVKAMVEKANNIIEAAKNSKDGAKGAFYNKTQSKALDDAQKKMKSENTGFYSDHIDDVREKTLKEIEKVSAMIDEKILAALSGMDAPKSEAPPMAPPAAPVMDPAAPMAPEVAPEAAGDAFDLKGGQMSDEDLAEMGAAMAEIEKALQAMNVNAKSEKSMPAEKSAKKSEMKKSAMKKSEKSEKAAEKSAEKSAMKKSVKADATADADYAQLKAEIDKLEAELNSANAADAPMEAPMGAGAPVMTPPAAAPVAPPAAAPSAPAAEGVAVEMIASVTELEADGPVAANAVQMHLYGESGLNPFWNITANGEPVGRVYLQDQADPAGDRAFFTSSKYVQGVSQAIEKVGLQDTLTSINAKFFANRIERAEVVQKLQIEADKVIKATVAQKTASLRDELVDRMLVAQSALDKNMFKEEGNSLKDAMFLQMQKFGVQNPVAYIEAAFEQGSSDYFKLILAKAIEYMDMEPKAFEQIKKTVANSDVLPAPEDATAPASLPEAQPTTLAAHLMSNNMPITFTHQTGAASSYANLKDSLRLGLDLKKTL